MEVSECLFGWLCCDVCAVTSESRFEVLTRDEALGQREELLQYAALPGERVTVGVTRGRQTAIVQAGAAEALVNFNRFFRDASRTLSMGDPQLQVTATIRRLPLGESGRPLPGEEEVLSPGQGRVSVSVDGVFQQYYVRIGDAAVTDSGVYTIEVCSQRGLPGEMCLNASATVFVLDGRLKEYYTGIHFDVPAHTLATAFTTPTATVTDAVTTDETTGSTGETDRPTDVTDRATDITADITTDITTDTTEVTSPSTDAPGMKIGSVLKCYYTSMYISDSVNVQLQGKTSQ